MYDVLGELTWIEAARRGPDEAWQRWNMDTIAIRGSEDVPADVAIVLLPVAPKVQESKPLEEVHLLRDEIANLVWGVETRVPLATGRAQAGAETGYEFRSKLQQLMFSVASFFVAFLIVAVLPGSILAVVLIVLIAVATDVAFFKAAIRSTRR